MADKIFTDRESGTYGGLMLSLRKYRNRLEAHPGYQLNRKPREIDCVILDKLDAAEEMDNDIARCFRKHNIIELKNPREVLSVDTIWKVISYAAQYKSEETAEDPRPMQEITVTLLRAARPKKAFSQLKALGYDVKNAYPGIYYISGLVDIKMQVVVSSELEGDDFVPLRLQRRNASKEDYKKFLGNVTGTYEKSENDYVATVLSYGMYDSVEVLKELRKEGKDMSMYDAFLEVYKDELDKRQAEAVAQAEARGTAQGVAQGENARRKLQEENAMLKKELAAAKAALA